MWILGLAIWVVLWVVDGLKEVVAILVQGGVPELRWAFTHAIPWWGVWLALTPLIVLAVRRFSPERRGWGASLAWHAGLFAPLVAALHILAAAVAFAIKNGSPPYAEIVVRNVRDFVSAHLLADLLTYAGVVGLLYSIEYFQRYRTREAEAQVLELKLARTEALATGARLEALTLQLQPHFLFNALNAVAGVVRRGERDRAVEMLSDLGTMLRGVLELDGAPLVPLSRELELIRPYIALERARFGSRLQVDINVPDALLEVQIPPLVLQPLLENAIRHGIASPAGTGVVRIEADRVGERVTITIRDHGAGAGDGVHHVDRGIGLANTRERLRVLFDGTATLDLVPNEAGGTDVRLCLPERHRRGSAA